MKAITFLTTVLFSLISLNSVAATIDGSITGSEYQWNTDGVEGSSKWNTHGGSQEYNDASGGDRWDINYLGTSIKNGQFQFGLIGGEILDGGITGSGRGNPIYLSDIAIGVTDFGVAATDPTTDSSGFQYAIRLLGVNNDTGIASFSLLEGGTWEGADIYDNDYAPDHITETYKMIGATKETFFSGSWGNNGGDDNVLEGGFDLSLLSIFDPSVGGRLSTYVTMACVNDEAYVTADVAAVPVPAALWLLTPALLGFMGLRRRIKT